MLKKIFSSGRPWLESLSGRDRLYILELCNVTDCFNYGELWEAEFSGNNTIIESKTKKADNRLQNALNIHQIVAPGKDNRGKLRRVKYVFADVIVHIPKELYLEDERDDGKQLMLLCQKLRELHQKNLTNFWKNRQPSYTITYHDQEIDKVFFQFGSSVFVPEVHDKLIATIQIQSNGQWYFLPKWSFWQETGKTYRDPGVYMNQDHLIIGHSYESCSICMPECFTNERSYVHINCNQRQAYGDGTHFETKSQVSHDNGNQSTTFEFYPINSSEKPVVIQWKDEYMPSPVVCLSGYAFLKNKKVSSWFIWLDQQGTPCSFNDAYIYFQGAHDKLHARKNDQKVYTELSFHNGLTDFEGYMITTPPEQMLSEYIGLLIIPPDFQKTLETMISNKKMIIGRSQANDIPDISLDYFSDPQSIRHMDTGKHGTGNSFLGQINLSRKQAILTWQSSTGKIFIQQMSTSAPIYILKSDIQTGEVYKDLLEPGSGREVELNLSDKLVIGTYILGFRSTAAGGTITNF